MARLSTHILDTKNGRPAAGVKIELFDGKNLLLTSTQTNTDGRTDAPLLTGDPLPAGIYEIRFHIGEYFGERTFLDVVPVRFQISDPSASYHVPLVCSPWAYSTYRGS